MQAAEDRAARCGESAQDRDRGKESGQRVRARFVAVRQDHVAESGRRVEPLDRHARFRRDLGPAGVRQRPVHIPDQTADPLPHEQPRIELAQMRQPQRRAQAAQQPWQARRRLADGQKPIGHG